MEAAAGQKLGLVLNLLVMMVPQVGVNSPLGKDLIDTIQKLGKHVPPGSVSPASQNNDIQNLQMRNAQQNQQMQAMRQRQMQGGGGGGPPGGGGGGEPPGMAA